LQRHSFATVETWDLQKAIIDATGMNMDWFFDQWIHRGGEPKLKVSTQTISLNGEKGIEFTVEQIHKIDPVVGVFKMPVDVALYFTDGSVQSQVVVIDKAFQKIFIPTKNKDVAFKLFDEGTFILKEIEFAKPLGELYAQLENANNTLDRFDALVALKSKLGEINTSQGSKDQYYNALLKAWSKETYKEMRVELANQLMLIPNLQSNIWTKMATDKTTEVRKTFILKAPLIEETKALFETALLDSSYLTIEAAIARMWNSPMFVNQHNMILDKIKGLDGYTHNLRIKYCELATEVYPDMKGSMIKALVDMSGPNFEFRTRILAMQALQRLNFLNDEFAMNLFDGMTTFNSRLNSPAIEVATYLNKQTEHSKTFGKTLNGYKGSIDALNKTEDIAKVRRILGY
jgi:aminopeptidase N